MSLITRRRNESLWKRLFHALKAESANDAVCAHEDFQLELAKEISRSNRRQQGREFSLVHFSLLGENRQMLSNAILESFQQRIRISDTIGWHSSNLAVLLPETDRGGAKLVTNDLVQLAARHGWNVDPTIYVYPWDDKLISVSNEIARIRNQTELTSSDDESVASDFSDGFERTDSFDAGETRDHGDSEIDFDRSGDGSVFSNSNGTGAVQLTARAVVPNPHTKLNHRSDWAASPTELTSVTGGPDLALSPAKEAELNSVVESIAGDVVQVNAAPWWKRAIDIVGAGTGLILLSPILLGTAVTIKMTSSGPILFRQRREGKGGKSFDILKFRTMVVDAEAKQASLRGVSEQDGPAFKLKDDPRVTAVGRKLRKSCIDELHNW